MHILIKQHSILVLTKPYASKLGPFFIYSSLQQNGAMTKVHTPAYCGLLYLHTFYQAAYIKESHSYGDHISQVGSSERQRLA